MYAFSERTYITQTVKMTGDIIIYWRADTIIVLVRVLVDQTILNNTLANLLK